MLGEAGLRDGRDGPEHIEPLPNVNGRLEGRDFERLPLLPGAPHDQDLPAPADDLKRLPLLLVDPLQLAANDRMGRITADPGISNHEQAARGEAPVGVPLAMDREGLPWEYVGWGLGRRIGGMPSVWRQGRSGA